MPPLGARGCDAFEYSGGHLPVMAKVNKAIPIKAPAVDGEIPALFHARPAWLATTKADWEAARHRL